MTTPGVDELQLARELRLSAKTAGTQTYGFIARKGAGKTYAASKLVEELIRCGCPVVVIDPIGNWYGLRLAADGKSPGLPVYIFGGMQGDLPIDIARGEDVASVIMTKGISAIVDVSALRKNERKRFVIAFAERLFHEAKKLRTPRVVVFEEAQVFAPQRAAGGDEARLLGAVEDIVRLGRNFGLGSVLISQRPQSVNKEVLNQVELLAVGQLSGPQERKAIRDWIVTKDDVSTTPMLDELPRLPVGTMFIWSPQWIGVFRRVEIAKKWTFDASATPELGKAVTKWTFVGGKEFVDTVDVASIQGALDALEEQKPAAKAGKADRRQDGRPSQSQDPAEQPGAVRTDNAAHVGELVHLRMELESLRAQLAERDARLAEVDKIVAEVEQFTGQLRARLPATPTSTRFATHPEPVYQGTHDVTPVTARARPAARVGKPSKPTRAQAQEAGIPTGAVALLRATASFPGTLTKAQIARACDLTISGGTFRTYWSLLTRHKYVEATSAHGLTWGATEAGVQVLGAERPKMGKTFRDRHAYWTSRLPAGAIRILTEALNAKRTLTRAQLADLSALDVTGGTFRTYVSLLTTNRLLRREGKSDLVVHPWLLTGKE